MASGNNNYNNNSLQPRLPFLCTPEQYAENQLWIQRQAGRFSELNRRGVETFLKMQSDLQRKITEGEQARQHMQYLQQIATSARAIAGPVDNRGGSSHYSGPGYVANQQPAVVPSSNYVNPVDIFMMNTQGAYIANAGPANASPITEQMPSSSRGQFSHSSGNTLQRDPAQFISAQNIASHVHSQADQGQQQNTQPQQLPLRSTDVNVDPTQQLARHPLARGQPSTVNPLSHMQRQEGSNAPRQTGPGLSSSHTQGTQRSPNGVHTVSQQSSAIDHSSTSGSLRMSSAGSSYQIPSSGSNSTLAGALGENSNVQAQESSINSCAPTAAMTQPDFWTIVANQGHSNSGPSASYARTQTTPGSIPISHHGSLHSTSHVPQHKATSMSTPAPALPSQSNKELSRAQADVAAALKAQLEIRTYANQGASSNVQNSVIFPHGQSSTNGAAGDPNVNTWRPAMQATSGHQNPTNVPPANNLQSMQTGHLINSLGRPLSTTPSNPNVSDAATAAAFRADLDSPRAQSSHSAPSTTENTNSPNAAFTAAGRKLNPIYTQTNAASLDPNAVNAVHRNASSIPVIHNPYSVDVPYSGTIGNPLPSIQNLQGVPISDNLHSTNQFATPPPDENRPSAPMTPASANKKTLAKDILRALNVPSKKRKASTPPSTAFDDDMQPVTKKTAVDPLPTALPEVSSELFATSSALLVTETDGAARIEEVDDVMMENEPIVSVSTPAAGATVAGTHEERPPVSDPFWASDAPSVPDSLPSQSAGESRASSEPALQVDTALQPLEDSSIPLFLPSLDSPRATPLSFLRKEETSKRRTGGVTASSQPHKHKKGQNRGMQVFVEVPTLSTAQRQRFLKQETGEKDMTESKGLPSVVRPQETSAIVHSNVVDENRLRLAWEASNVAASRLRKRPCPWNDCSHVANNATGLKVHVWDHVDMIPSKEKLFPCWWGDCIRRFNKREALAQHLQNHVKKSIFCAYQGCDEQFMHSLELLTHVESKHPSGSRLRPSVTPFEPPRQSPPPLRTMFAYHDVDLPVQMARMTKERRAKLGPWVAKNCFGAVSFGTPKLIARNQPQRRRAGDAEAKVLGTWQDKYDFAEPWNATYPAHCADLESSRATEDIEGGLLLAPDVAGPQGPLEEQMLTSRVDRIKLKDTQDYAFMVEHNSEEPEVEVSEIKLEDSYAGLSQGPPLSSASQGSEGVGYQDFLRVGEPQLVESGSA